MLPTLVAAAVAARVMVYVVPLFISSVKPVGASQLEYPVATILLVGLEVPAQLKHPTITLVSEVLNGT